MEISMKTKILSHLKKDPVLYASCLIAAISAFFVAPSAAYMGYIDWHVLGLLLALMLALVMGMSLVACGGGEEASAYDVAAVAKTIEDKNPIRMSTPIEQDYIDFIGLTEDMYSAYAGSYCPITPGVDVIIVVEAKDGKIEEKEVIKFTIINDYDL